MISAEWRTTGQPKVGLRLALVWLLVASGSVVYFEPAPYDVLAMLLVFGFVVLGKLRIPTRLAAPLFFLGIFLFANFLSAAISTDPPRTIWYLSVTTYLMITWVFFTCLVYENPERVLGVIWKGYFVAAACEGCGSVLK